MAFRGCVLALMAAVCLGAPVSAQSVAGRCADCHFANFFDVPGREYLGDWQQSPHARHGVGCEGCHGGDASSVHPIEAHRGVLGSRNPASPVNLLNLPATCGACHGGPLTGFKKSRHYAMLNQADFHAPSCSTCHGAMTARVPSPVALERDCARCHSPQSPTADYPALARVGVERIRDVRAVFDRAHAAIATLEPDSRRQRMTAEYRLALTSFAQAVDAVHTFDLRVVDARAATARRQADELMRRVVNPDR